MERGAYDAKHRNFCAPDDLSNFVAREDPLAGGFLVTTQMKFRGHYEARSLRSHDSSIASVDWPAIAGRGITMKGENDGETGIGGDSGF